MLVVGALFSRSSTYMTGFEEQKNDGMKENVILNFLQKKIPMF